MERIKNFIVPIMAATGRFELQETHQDNYVFVDSHDDTEVVVNKHLTLPELMAFITNAYYNDGVSRGERNARLEIRKALGV